jgi:hypothetical protein
MMAAADKTAEGARGVFFGLVAVWLVGWALWNLAADAYLQNVLGRGYDHAIGADVPG